MHTLPKDITNEISQYLPLPSQPAWRRVSKRMRESNFNWDEQCCVEPLPNEIADFLLEQSNIINNGGVSLFKSWISDNYLTGFDIILYNIHNSSETSEVLINIINGVIKIYKNGENERGNLINSRNELISFLHDKNMVLANDGSHYISFYSSIWMMVKHIISKRNKCIKHGFNNKKCFIKLLAKYLPVYSDDNRNYISNSRRVLEKVLKPEVYEKFLIDFIRQLGIFMYYSSMSNLLNNLRDFQDTYPISSDSWLYPWLDQFPSMIDASASDIPRDKSNNWLQNWLLQLQPLDLV